MLGVDKAGGPSRRAQARFPQGFLLYLLSLVHGRMQAEEEKAAPCWALEEIGRKEG